MLFDRDDIYDWKYNWNKPIYNFDDLIPFRSVKSDKSYWKHMGVDDDQKTCYSLKTGIGAESNYSYKTGIGVESAYSYKNSVRSPSPVRKTYNSKYDKIYANYYSDDDNNSSFWNNFDRKIADKSSKSKDKYDNYLLKSRSPPSYRKLRDNCNDMQVRFKENDEEYYKNKEKRYDEAYTRKTLNSKSKHKMPQPEIPYEVRMKRAKEWLKKAEEEHYKISDFIFMPNTPEEWAIWGRQLASKQHIFDACRPVAKNQSHRNSILIPKPRKLFIAPKKFFSNAFNKMKNQIVKYYEHITVTPFTHNKEGVSFGGAEYTSAAPNPAPNQQNHVPQEGNSVQNPIEMHANSQAEYFNTRPYLQNPDRGELSTAHITFYVKAAIEASPNAEHIAFLDPVFFNGQQSNPARYVENWNPDTTTSLVLPYCRGSHHRFFIYERNINSTGYATVSHFDPYGHPTDLVPTRIKPEHRARAQEIIEAIEGQRVNTRWLEPFIPEIAQQPTNNKIDCGAHLIAYIITYVSGHNLADIATFNIQEVRQYLKIAMDYLLQHNEIPTEILLHVPWTYHPSTLIPQQPAVSSDYVAMDTSTTPFTETMQQPTTLPSISISPQPIHPTQHDLPQQPIPPSQHAQQLINDANVAATLNERNAERARAHIPQLRYRLANTGNPITLQSDISEEEVDSLFTLIAPSLTNSRHAYYLCSSFWAYDFDWDSLVNYSADYSTHVHFINTDGNHFRQFVYHIPTNQLYHINSFGNERRIPQNVENQCRSLINKLTASFPDRTLPYPRFHQTLYQPQYDGISCGFRNIAYFEYAAKGYDLATLQYDNGAYVQRCIDIIDAALTQDEIPAHLLGYVPTVRSLPTVAIPQPQQTKKPLNQRQFAPRASAKAAQKSKTLQLPAKKITKTPSKALQTNVIPPLTPKNLRNPLPALSNKTKKLLPMAPSTSTKQPAPLIQNDVNANTGKLISILEHMTHLNPVNPALPNISKTAQQQQGPQQQQPRSESPTLMDFTSNASLINVQATPVNALSPIKLQRLNGIATATPQRTPFNNITNTLILDDISIKNPEYLSPLRSQNARRKANTDSQRKRRQTIANFNDPHATPLRPIKTPRRKSADTIYSNNQTPQRNNIGQQFFDIKQLSLNDAQQQFLRAIEINKGSIALAQAIEVLLQIAELQITLDDNDMLNFINVISDEQKRQWQQKGKDRRKHIIDRKDLQQIKLLRDNMNEIIQLINGNEIIIEQLQEYTGLAQHDKAITTLGLLFDLLYGAEDVTAEMINESIKTITLQINKLDRIRETTWEAFLPVREKFNKILGLTIAGRRGTNDFYNRQILGFSFHSINRWEKGDYPNIDDIFDKIYSNFMKCNEDGNHVFYHPGESCQDFKNDEKLFPWIYNFKPLVEDEDVHMFDDFNPVSQISTINQHPQNTFPQKTGPLNDEIPTQSSLSSSVSSRNANNFETSKNFLQFQIEQEHEQVHEETGDMKMPSFYYNSTRAKLCTSDCPKIQPQLGRKLYNALRQITQCTEANIVPYMAQFEANFLPLIEKHAPCFQGLRTILRKLRTVREFIGILSKSDKCLAECNYILLQDLTTYRIIPASIKRILQLADLPLPAIQTEAWAYGKFGKYLEEFRNADSDIQDKICQVCHRITAGSLINNIDTTDPIIQTIGRYIIHPNDQPQQAVNEGQYYSICYYCRKDMIKDKIPKFSTYNGFITEVLPPQLEVLNDIEWALIKKIRPLMSFTTVQPKTSHTDTAVPHFSGTMLHILNPVEENFDYVAKTLPSCEHMKIAVKWNPDSPRIHLVRLDVMLNALRWLKEHNPHYADITINENFQFSQGAVCFDPQEANAQLADLIDPQPMEVTISQNPERRSPTLQLDQRLLQIEIPATGPVLQRYCMNKMNALDMMKIFEKHLDVQCFPELHPTGFYGIDYERGRPVRQADYMKARLNNFTRKFSDKSYIAFCKSLKDVKAVFGPIGASFRQIKNNVETDKLIECLNNRSYDPLVDRLMSVTFKSIIGSYDYNQDQMQKCKTMVDYFGKFDLWMTFNPAEWDWINLEKTIRAIYRIPNDNEIDINEYAIKDAPIFSQYFHNRLQNFLRKVILIPNGPFGEIIHNFRHYEWQGRGATHCHGVYWLKNPIAFNGDNEAEIIKRIDECVTVRRPDPITEPRGYDLVNRFQTHSCTDSCLKNVGIVKYCRYGFPFKETDKTQINHKSGKLALSSGSTQKEYYVKRNKLECNINGYNMAALIEWNGNMDIQITLSQDISYVIQYIEKYLQNNEMAKKVQRQNDKQLSEGLKCDEMASIAFRYINSKNISINEAAHHILQLPTHQASCECKFLPVDPPEKRRRFINTKLKDDEEITHENVFTKSLLDDYYPNRDPELHDFSVFNIVTMFDVQKIQENGKLLNEEAEESISVEYDMTNVSDDTLLEINPTEAEKHRQTLFGGNPYDKSNFGIWRYASPIFCHGNKKAKSKFKTGVTGYVFVLRDKAVVYRFFIPILDKANDETSEEHYHRLLLLFKPFITEAEIIPVNGTYKNHWNEYFNHLLVKDPEASNDILRLIGPRHQRLLQQIQHSNEKRLGELKALQDVDIDPYEDEFNKVMLPFKTKNIDGDKLEEDIEKLSKEEQRPLFEKIINKIQQQKNFKTLKTKEHPGQILQIISGVGGVGKSFFIEVLSDKLTYDYSNPQNQYQNPAVIRAAPTALAAKHIKGGTLHSIFGITRDTAILEPLSKAALNAKQAIFKDVECLIFDEGGMIGRVLFAKLHQRCQEIKSCTSKPFGGFNVILLGDLCQLPPVMDGPIYTALTAFEAEKYFNGIAAETNLWRAFEYAEFTINQRQKDEYEFANLLSRFRIGTATEEDFEKLKTRIIPAASEKPSSAKEQAQYFIEMLKSDEKAIALFSKRRPAMEFNNEVMSQLALSTFDIQADDTRKKTMTKPWQRNQYAKECDNKAVEHLKADMDELNSKYENLIFNQKDTDPVIISMNAEAGEQLANEKAMKKTEQDKQQREEANEEFLRKQLGSETAALPEVIRLAIGCRVMLTKNINADAGLLNGATGFLRNVYGQQFKNDDESKTFHAEELEIEFDHAPGKLQRIKRETATFYIDKTRKQQINRAQFPIIVAYGCTIHKCQGMTVDNALMCLKECFAPGQAYVALSRVKTLNGLHIANWSDDCMMVNEKAIVEYNRLRATVGMPPYPTAAERAPLRNPKFPSSSKTCLPAVKASTIVLPLPPPSTPPPPSIHKSQLKSITTTPKNVMHRISPSLNNKILQHKKSEIFHLQFINGDQNLSFANASFQALRVVPELLQYVEQHQHESIEMTELYNICSHIGTDNAADMSRIRALLPNANQNVEMNPKMFFEWFFNLLNDEIKNQFFFTTTDTFTCQKCHHKTEDEVQNNIFFELDLAETNQSMNQLLQSLNYGRAPKIQCVGCNTEGEHNVQRTVSFPTITDGKQRYMIMILNRFQADNQINLTQIVHHRATEQMIANKAWYLKSAIEIPLGQNTEYVAHLKDEKSKVWLKIQDSVETEYGRKPPENLQRIYIMLYRETTKRQR